MNAKETNCACTTTCALPQAGPYYKSLISGAMGGLAGAVVVIVMQAAKGGLSTVAALVGSQSSLVGFLVLFLPALVGGMLAGILLRFIPKCPMRTAMAAMAYGLLLWAIVTLIVVPLLSKAPLFSLNNFDNMAMLKYVIYAVVTFFVSRMFTACVCEKH